MNWIKLLSKERINSSSHDTTDFDARSEFQRDMDRIIFSSAFRRLQDKTQVMPLPQSDYVRSRLTHSMEVASIGRSLGKVVGKYVIDREKLAADIATEEDFGNIVVAACLAHDIGNPPFGQSGEKAIGKFFNGFFKNNPDVTSTLSKAQLRDLVHFEGNAAGFRILANDHPSGRSGGYRLTVATIGAFSKYPKGSLVTTYNELGSCVNERKSQSKFGFFQEEANTFEGIAEKLELLSINQGIEKAWVRHPLAFLMEAADSLTYSIIDFEDAHKLKYIDTSKAEELLYAIVKRTPDKRCNTEDWRTINEPSERIGALRAKALNSLIFECRTLFIDNYDSILEGKFDKELPDAIPSSNDLNEIKKVSRENFYNHSTVIDIELAGFDVLGGLLDSFVQIAIEIHTNGEIRDPRNTRLLQKMSQQFSSALIKEDASLYQRLLICTDFVSRMTDGFAMKLYKKIKGIEL